MHNKLRQPTKYTHKALQKASSSSSSSSSCSPQPAQKSGNNNHPQKSKQIKKLKNKKIITKPNQPSALRLAAINETFHKIQHNAQHMMDDFQVDRQLLNTLLGYQGKVKCQCGRNIKYYCLKCGHVNQELGLPKVKLGFQVTVLHHQSQKINKSSIAPMCLLSPSIALHKYPSTPHPLPACLSQMDPSSTCILFPHKNSKKVSQQNFHKIKNIVVLDCTWFQTDQMIGSLEEEGFDNFVRLDQYESLFWRYNHHSQKALSSAQALAYFFREYHVAVGENMKQDDQIMLLYLLNLKIVQNSYRKQAGNEKEPTDKQDIKQQQIQTAEKKQEKQVKQNKQEKQGKQDNLNN